MTTPTDEPLPPTVPVLGVAEEIPRGYVRRLAVAQLGVNMALLAPVIGGLSVKIQHLVGVEAAPTQLGLVTGAGAAFALVSQPVAGRLSDRCTSRWGMRRPFVAAGAVAMVLGLVVCALAESVPVLLLGWCFTQAAANVALAGLGATVADQVPDARRGVVSGVVGAVVPLGIVTGAVLLAVLPTDALRFLVPGIVALVGGLWFSSRLKDKVRAEPVAVPLDLRTLVSSFVFDPRKHPDFAWAWASKFLIILAFSALASYLTLFLAEEFGMTDTDEQLRFNAIANGLSVAALVVCSIVGGIWSDRVGRRKPFVIGAGLVMAVGLLGIAGTPYLGDAGLPALLACATVIGLGAGMFFAVDNALCLSLLPAEEDTAKDLGVLNIANTLPQSLSPFLAGVVVIPTANALLGGGGYSVWFALAAVCCAAGALLVRRIENAT